MGNQLVSKTFIHHIRARYAETDAQSVVHHSAYVAWLEEARIEALREAGWSYRDLEASGVFMPVIDVHIRYRRPFRFDDVCTIMTTAELRGPGRVTFSSVLSCGDQQRATAEVTIAALDASGRPQRMPAELSAALLGAQPPPAS